MKLELPKGPGLYKWNDPKRFKLIPKLMAYVFVLITLTKAKSIFEG
jgi:hypothetical protein